MTGKVDVRIPGAIYQMAAMMNAQAGSLVAMGVLVQDGEDYVMNAEYAQGLFNRETVRRCRSRCRNSPSVTQVQLLRPVAGNRCAGHRQRFRQFFPNRRRLRADNAG